MPVVCLINRKGGVGKTTLTLALSDFLSSAYQKRVLLLDLDPQANLTLACVTESRWEALNRRGLTVADVFGAIVDGNRYTVHQETTNRISGAIPVKLLASTPRLADIEAEAMEGDSSWRRRVGSPYLVLHRALGRIPESFDYVLIDCPPSLGVITLNGLSLADGYLIPVMPSPVAITGIELLAEKIDGLARGLHRKLKRYGTIINRIDSNTNLHNAIVRELQGNPDARPVWASTVRNSIRAEEAWDHPEPRTLHQRWGRLYPDLLALTEEFLRRVY